MIRILLAIGTLPLIALAMLVGTGTALAEDNESGLLSRGIFGSLESLDIDDEGTGSLELESGEIVAVNEVTAYHLPTFILPWQMWSELSEEAKSYLQPEARIAVLMDEDKEAALKVMLIPRAHVRAHHRGVITEVNGNAVTLMNREGNQYTYTFQKGLPYGIEQGELVTLVTSDVGTEQRRLAVAGCDSQLLSLQLRHRLESTENQELRERLLDTINEDYQKRLRILEQMRTRAQEIVHGEEMAQQAIDQALQRAEVEHEECLRIMEQVRTRASKG
ncbi:MAG: hypothetical protein SVY53_12620 [Chloroflexota bacterium]|nr:hypothetical protein [Chloroflexota bacterium]